MAAVATPIHRWTAVALLGMSAAYSAVVVGLYLRGIDDWGHAFSVALEPDSPIRYLFPVLITGGVLSLLGVLIVAVSRHRTMLRLVLGLVGIMTIAYGVLGAWSLALVSALPLWSVYRVST